MSENLLIAKAQKRVAALLKDLQIIGGEEAVARLDAELSDAEERGRRAGYAEAVREAGNLAVVYGKGEWSDTLVKLIRALAPRDSGKDQP